MSNLTFVHNLTNLTMSSDVLYLEVCNQPGNDLKAEVTPETLIMLSVHRFCKAEIDVRWVQIENTTGIHVQLPENAKPAEDGCNMTQWCRLPALGTSTDGCAGLCSAARRLAASCAVNEPSIHPQGLLGFRSSCLQAPNETSVWTKFCEIESPTMLADYAQNKLNTIPEAIIKFENHLMKPVRVHNVYKLAHELAKSSIATKTNESADGDTPKRSNSKQRKWKSNSQVTIDKSLPLEDLGLTHDFAEGPYLTIADLILYPCFYSILSHSNTEKLANIAPTVMKWFNRLRDLKLFTGVNELLISDRNLPSFDCVDGVPIVRDASLYKHDPKRNANKKKMYTKEDDIEEALNLIGTSAELPWIMNEGSEVDWSKIHPDASPLGGHLPEDRMQRKTQQLENLATATMNIARHGDVIVDFCSGGGHLGILLAYLLPDCSVLLLENKEQSLRRARDRVDALNLPNVHFIQCNLDFFKGSFDIGVALHACGVSTDLVLDNCINMNAAFVVCPCCYGSLHETDRLKYPKSKEFSHMPIDRYLCLGHAADQTHADHPMEERGARCMAAIDSDRARHAMNRGYDVTLKRLNPLTCTPKNMMIIGIPNKTTSK